MGPITSIIPVRRPVRLGETEYRVGELRLLDLAELQSCLDDREADPLENLFPQLETADEETARKLMADAYEAVERGPATIWGDQAFQWFTTVEGLATLLVVALRRWYEIGFDEAVELATKITWWQYLKLRRVVFGAKPRKTLERLMGLRSVAAGPTATWMEMIADLATGPHPVPLSVIYGYTFTEFAALRTGGKPASEEEGIPTDLEGADLLTAMREQYKRFHGHYPPKEAPNG